VAEAIDRRAIITGVVRGLAEPIGDFVPPEVFGHVPGLEVFARPAPTLWPRPGPLGDPEPDLFLMGWSNATGDAALEYHALAHTPGDDAEGSLSGYSSPLVDRLLAEAAEAPSQPVRRRRLRQLAEALAADLALVLLYRVLDRYSFAPGLELTPRMDRRIRAQDMRWTSPPRGRGCRGPPAQPAGAPRGGPRRPGAVVLANAAWLVLSAASASGPPGDERLALRLLATVPSAPRTRRTSTPATSSSGRVVRDLLAAAPT
jgi:hypothetical protein